MLPAQPGSTRRQARCERYRWEQTLSDVVISIDEPVVGGAVDCRIRSRDLRVRIGETTIIDGELFDIISCDASTWTRGDDGVLEITLNKVHQGWWDRVVEGDPSIDDEVPAPSTGAASEVPIADPEVKTSVPEQMVEPSGVLMSIAYRGATSRVRFPRGQHRGEKSAALVAWIAAKIDTAPIFNKAQTQATAHPDLEATGCEDLINLLVGSEEKRFRSIQARQEARRKERSQRREKARAMRDARRQRREARKKAREARVRAAAAAAEAQQVAEERSVEEAADDGKVRADVECGESPPDTSGDQDMATGSGGDEKKAPNVVSADGKAPQQTPSQEQKADERARSDGAKSDDDDEGPDNEGPDNEGSEEKEDEPIPDVSDDSSDVQLDSIQIQVYATMPKKSEIQKSDGKHLVVRAPVLYDTPELGVVRRVRAESKDGPARVCSGSSAGWDAKVNLQIRSMKGVHQVDATERVLVSELKTMLVSKFGVAKGFALCYPQIGILHSDMALRDVGLAKDSAHMLFVMPNPKPERLENAQGPWYIDLDTGMRVNRLNPSRPPPRPSEQA